MPVSIERTSTELTSELLRNRLDQLKSVEIDYIPSEQFAEPHASELLAEASELNELLVRAESASTAPAELPAHLRRLCEAELLTADEESLLFRQMNFLKFRSVELIERSHQTEPCEQTILEVEESLDRVRRIRDTLVRANMRLAISIAKRLVTPPFSFDDILSEGTFTLVQTVDKFDYSRGFRFSTYAYRSISHNVYRIVNNRRREESRFVSDSDGWPIGEPEGSVTSTMTDDVWHGLRRQTREMMEKLDRREKFIIRSRYALGAHRNVKTFQSLADILGVSKERVRQLESRAVGKLKKMAAEFDGFDLLTTLSA